MSFVSNLFFGHRRPRQSDKAAFFNSLDENSDGVLAEDEIREASGAHYCWFSTA